MGISPSELLAMSLHDYQAATYHWSHSQGGDEDEPEGLSGSDFDTMLDALNSEAMH